MPLLYSFWVISRSVSKFDFWSTNERLQKLSYIKIFPLRRPGLIDEKLWYQNVIFRKTTFNNMLRKEDARKEKSCTLAQNAESVMYSENTWWTTWEPSTPRKPRLSIPIDYRTLKVSLNCSQTISLIYVIQVISVVTYHLQMAVNCGPTKTGCI